MKDRNKARLDRETLEAQLRRDARRVQPAASPTLQRQILRRVNDTAMTSSRTTSRNGMAPAALLAAMVTLLVATVASLPLASDTASSDMTTIAVRPPETTEARRKIVAMKDRLVATEDPLVREARGMIEDARSAARFVLSRLPAAPRSGHDAS